MNEVISEESAYKMIDMLQSVIDHGTGRRLRYKFKLTAPMEERPEPPTETQTDGL